MHRDQWRHLFDSGDANKFVWNYTNTTQEQRKRRISLMIDWLVIHDFGVSVRAEHIDENCSPFLATVIDFLFDTGLVNDAALVRLNDDALPIFDMTNGNQDDTDALMSAMKWMARETREFKQNSQR